MDGFLDEPIELVLYGKAALHCLFPKESDFEVTNDVDIIIPSIQVQPIEERHDFWDALEKTNQALEQHGLYMTHLFEESQVLIHKDWMDNRIQLTKHLLTKLELFVLAPIDLALTKMMRIDPEDRKDLEFIIRKANLRVEQLKSHWEGAICPEPKEIKEAFEANKKWVLESFPS